MATEHNPEGGAAHRPFTPPLAGVRVLDLTNVLAGPYCCYQLALLGAEVIKVERPDGGDLARQLGADPARNDAQMGISFLAQNAGKASITLDLKHPDGKALLRKLVAGADVLVENFRPGVMDRLELGYDALRAENPALIYCAISGFGQDGPWKDNPAYDQIVQGVAGVMAITGDADSAPLRTGYPLGDTIGGMTAAFAISAALNATPRGAFLDIAMSEAVLSTMGWVVSNLLIGGVPPQPNGNENMTSAPSGTFATADAPINIAANRDTQWQALTDCLNRPDLLSHPDYATRERRKANRHALRAELESVLTTRPAAHWVDLLNRHDIPAGPVLTVAEALSNPQTAGRGLITALETGPETLPLTASPIRFGTDRPAPQTPPPSLGADTDRVLSALGMSAQEISDLRARKIV